MRKPADQIRRGESRDAVWEVIRKLGAAGLTFTVRDIRQETRLTTSSVAEYLTGLTRAGYLAQEPAAGKFQPARFTLVKDIGHEAPRVRKDGSAVTMGQGRDQMWRALWILAQKGQRFTVKELVLDSSTAIHAVAEAEADTYLHYLAAAGYVGKRGDTYFMPVSRWTGPKPPMIQRVHQVWDPNTRQVVWTDGSASLTDRGSSSLTDRGGSHDHD